MVGLEDTLDEDQVILDTDDVPEYFDESRDTDNMFGTCIEMIYDKPSLAKFKDGDELTSFVDLMPHSSNNSQDNQRTNIDTNSKPDDEFEQIGPMQLAKFSNPENDMTNKTVQQEFKFGALERSDS